MHGFLEEVLESRVSQVEVVFGVMGITGLLVGGFRFLIAHPTVTGSILLVGLLATVAVTMFGFAVKSRLVDAPVTSEQDLSALLHLLLQQGSLPPARISDELRITGARLTALLERADADGWITRQSGAFKVTESMRPIARLRLARRSARGSLEHG